MDPQPAEPALAPLAVAWDPGLATGHATLDTQHQALLARCTELAAHCSGDETAFAQRVQQLQVLAAEHFEAEAAVLAAAAGADADAAEDHRLECEEFHHLLADVATAEHFSPVELQRFLALWWLGHVKEMAGRLCSAAPP